MFLELVSIIIDGIFFSSLLLLYHVSNASSHRVSKLVGGQFIYILPP